MATLDPVGDFIELTVSQGYDDAATQIDIVATDVHWANLPDPTTDGAYNLLWYDATNYWSNPQDDPNKEWVRVTNWNEPSYRLIVTRAQQGTSATTKNTSGATYKMIMAIGKKFRDDIENATVDVGSNYAWITEYDAVGDGVTDDKAAFVAAVAAGITHIVIPSGTWRFSDDYTIADTVTLEFLRNAQLAPDTGKTVTVNGPVLAGNWDIMAGSGTVSIAARGGMGYDRWDGTATDGINMPGALEVTGRLRTLDRAMLPVKAAALSTPAQGEMVLADRATWDPCSLGDGGQYLVHHDGTNYIPLLGYKVVESAAISCATGGTRTCEIAHGLSYTPAAKDINIANVYRTAGSDPLTLRTLSINTIDGTNVDLYFYVISSYSGLEAKVVLWIRI